EQPLLPPLCRQPAGVELLLLGGDGAARRRPGVWVSQRVLPAQGDPACAEHGATGHRGQPRERDRRPIPAARIHTGAPARRARAPIHAERARTTAHAERARTTAHAERARTTAHAERARTTAHPERARTTAHAERARAAPGLTGSVPGRSRQAALPGG